MPFLLRSFCAVQLALLLAGPLHAQAPFPFHAGESVVFLGNTFAERMQHFGHFEVLLQRQFPAHQLRVRNLGHAGDAVGFQPRPLNFRPQDSLLTDYRADVIFAFFGMNEAFNGPDSLAAFEAHLTALLTHLTTQRYNGTTAPRVVLVSPIAHETLGGHLPDPTAHNQHLAAYTAAMRTVAAAQGVRFIDLFTPTRTRPANALPLTFNGIHPTDAGYRETARLMAASLGFAPAPMAAEPDPLREAILAKNQHVFYRWRPLNGEYIYGRRKEPFGVINFPAEFVKIDRMVAALDTVVWHTAQGKPAQALDAIVGPSGSVPYVEYPEAAARLAGPVDLSQFTLADGYRIELVASEQDFPIGSPVSLTFDDQGRMWVMTMPTYPQYYPGLPPNDKLVILEDQDGDGRMDHHTVFADGLYIPTGFELGDGGAYVAQQPDLMFLQDTDGDDVADVRQRLLHGFDTGDSHHSISAFTWGPGGGLYMHEGTFHVTRVETPYGPVGGYYGATYRYDPRTAYLENIVPYNYANPWGQVFDRWGQYIIADASGGHNYFAAPLLGAADYPQKRSPLQYFTTIVRPTAGVEMVSGAHFPDAVQGNLLINNTIGFQGIKMHRIIEEGAGYWSEEVEPLVQSSDLNFRPVDLQFGPDGALYVVDWYNPLIGHMQYSLRDPGRDHGHGRIWRITYPDRPLLTPLNLAELSTPDLLDQLKADFDRTRYRARRALRAREETAVAEALGTWTAGLDRADPNHEAHLLEALWMYQQLNRFNPQLLEQLLRAEDHRVRAAATRVARFWRDELDDPVALFTRQVADAHPLVRLEAVTALSFFRTEVGLRSALGVLAQPMDYYLKYALGETVRHMAPLWKPRLLNDPAFLADDAAGYGYLLKRLNKDELLALPARRLVLEQRLVHPGLTRTARAAALDSLAALTGQARVQLLADALGVLSEAEAVRADLVNSTVAEMFGGSGGGFEPAVLEDVAALLLSASPAELAAVPQLLDLAQTAPHAEVRQVAYAGLLTARQGQGAQRLAEQSTQDMMDYLNATAWIEDAGVRAGQYDLLRALTHTLPPPLESNTPEVRGRYVRVEPLDGNLNLSGIGAWSGPEGVPGLLTQQEGAAPWAELDLGTARPLTHVVVHSGGAASFSKRMQHYRVRVLDPDRLPVFEAVYNQADAEASARYTVSDNASAALHRRAIAALGHVPGRTAEKIAALAGFVEDGAYRDVAVQALLRHTDAPWPALEAAQLAGVLAGVMAQTSPAQQSTEAYLALLQLGEALVEKLPAGQTTGLRAAMGNTAMQTVRLTSLEGQLRFDLADFEVQAGGLVEIIFTNADLMQHNVLITSPGALETVGRAADDMARAPDGFQKQFIPANPNVLFASPLIDPGATYTLRFVAPEEPGDYPFVCTFPGHWRTMNGLMQVKP